MLPREVYESRRVGVLFALAHGAHYWRKEVSVRLLLKNRKSTRLARAAFVSFYRVSITWSREGSKFDASTQVRTLARNGLLHRHRDGRLSVTDAGRALLQEEFWGRAPAAAALH